VIFARRGIDGAVKGRRDGLSGRSSEIDPREGIVMGGWGAAVVMGGGLETEVLDEDPLESTNFSASRLTLSQDSIYFRYANLRLRATSQESRII
jgi:hypothetical protein